MKVMGNQLYRFGGFEMDPAQGCLRRDGKELYPRQKSFHVLWYLIEQRHRLVTKEELIGRAWEGLAVTDDALVQLIREIRRILGDDPRQPRFIKTVPKGGYRFIALVEEFFVDPPMMIEIDQQSSVEIEYEEEIAGVPESGRGIEAQSSSQAGARNQLATRRRPVSVSLRFVVIAIALAVLVGAALAGYFLRRAPSRSVQTAEVALPVLPGKKALVVMYFENQSGSPDLDWLRAGLADMLISNLSRSKRLNVLSRQQLSLLIERGGHSQTDAIRLDEALEIAHKSRAEVIVLGRYVRLGEKIRIDVQLHNAENGQSLADESLVADKPQDILAQMDLLSLKLAAHLGAAAETPEGEAKPDEALTRNLEAYRNYSLAVEKAQALHNTEAIALLEKAVTLDPQFAMAYARIGYAYTVTWNFPDKAKPYLEKAFQLAERLSERDKLYINGWYAIANLDYAGAIAVFQQIIAAYPMEIEAYERLCSLLLGEDRLAEALEVVMRGLVVDAQSPNLLNQCSGIYFRLGRNDEAIATAQRYIAIMPNEANAYDTLGLYYQWIGRYPEAIAAYQEAIRLNPEFDVAVIHLGNTYCQQGRYQEALEQYRRYIKVGPSVQERARGYSSIADLYWRQGDLLRSEQAAKQAEAADRRSAYHFIILNLDRGNIRAAEALSKRFFAEWAPFPNRGKRATQRLPHYLHGYLHLRSGRPEEALAEFKEALRSLAPFWTLESHEDCLANAYLELARFDEAIAEYERILRVNPNYPLAQYHLGQAYQRKGQPDKARSAYERFLQIWKDADADTSEVTSARKALAG